MVRVKHFMPRNRKGLSGMLGAGLIGVSTLGGCVSLEDQLAQGKIDQAQYRAGKQRQNAQMTSLFGGLLGGLGAQRGQPGAVFLGQAISAHGAAEAGGSEVNVYNAPQAQPSYTPQPQQVIQTEPLNNPNNGPHSFYHSRFGEIIVGTCNYVFDKNNNRREDYPAEFNGLKDRFWANEKITVKMGSPSLIPDLSFKLMDGNGSMVDSFSNKDEGVNEAYGIQRIYNVDSNCNIQLNRGDYHALWYSGSELLAQWQFKVGGELVK